MNISIFSREINSTFGDMSDFKKFLESISEILSNIGEKDNKLNLKISDFLLKLSEIKEKYKKSDLDELSKRYSNSIFSCEEIDQIKEILLKYKEINKKDFEESEEFLEIINSELLLLRNLIKNNIKEADLSEKDKATLEKFKKLNTKEKSEKLTKLKNEEDLYKDLTENFKKIDSVLEKIDSFRNKFNEIQKNKTEEIVEETSNQVIEIVEEKLEETIEKYEEITTIETSSENNQEKLKEIIEIKEDINEKIPEIVMEEKEIILSEEEKIINQINYLYTQKNNDEIINKVLKLCELEFDKEKLKEIFATKIYLNSLKKEQNEKIIRIQEYIYGKKTETKKENNGSKAPVKKRAYSISVANKLKNIDGRKKYLEDLKETENFDEIYEYLEELRKYQLFPLLSLEIIELLVNNEKEYDLNGFFNAIREKGLKNENPDFEKFKEKCAKLEEIFGNKILKIEKVGDKVEGIIKEEKISEIGAKIVDPKEDIKTQILTNKEITEVIKESLEELENDQKGVILDDKETEEFIDEGLKNIDIFINLKKFAKEKNISGVYSALLYAYNLGEEIDIKEIEKILKKLFEDTKDTENKKDLEYIKELKQLFGEIYLS
ncbi:MAG: hypothetical protein PHR68_04610 [Candidatus Gracilibacteria bacterium]|nr:hypothetical protein [Candidatus Gracilibacteria bacterium]